MSFNALDTIAGYKVVRTLGQGGSATVYLAEQSSTQQHVAIKVLRFDSNVNHYQRRRLLERFDRETKVCAELKHPHIVKLIDKGKTATDTLFAVFEYVPGLTLKEYLIQHGPMSGVETGRIMGQVLDALASAHQHGVVHRDLKPSNIMLNNTGAGVHAMVLDFGISTFIDHAKTGVSDLTLTKETLGTPSYSSPEQLRGEPPSAKSDIYAWGLVCLECLTGQPAIHGNTLAEIFHKQLSPVGIPIPSTIAGHPFANLLTRTLYKSQKERAEDAKRLYQELQTLNLYSIVGQVKSDIPSLDQDLEATQTLNTTWSGFNSERRQLTVLCFELQLTTQSNVSVDIDLQDEMLADQLSLCIDTCTSLGGYHCSTLGNLVLVYVGYPEVTDNDARKAARIALQLISEIQQRSALLEAQHQLSLSLRIAIHTGMMITSFGQTPAGATANTALAILRSSIPGPVLISHEAKQILEPFLLFEPAGQLSNRKHVNIDRLVGERRSEAMSFLRPSSISRTLIGRGPACDSITEAWETLHEGIKITLIVGEAGVGKSRLLFSLRKTLIDAQKHTLFCQCLSEQRNSALFPILALIKYRLSLENSDKNAASKHLSQMLSDEYFEKTYGIPRQISIPILCSWLELPLPSGMRFTPLPPEQQKDAIFKTLAAMLARITDKQKSMLIIEDFHWIDPTSIEFIEWMQSHTSASPLLIVATTRPNLPAHINSQAFEHKIHLTRLTQTETQQLVSEILGNASIEDAVIAWIYTRTDGIPLYVEELTQMLLDNHMLYSHKQSYRLKEASFEIPISIRDSLTHKLDRLGLAKETAQLAATIGREFDYPLLVAASLKHESDIQSDLQKMQEADLIYPHRQVQKTSYIFKHALLRDTAYDSVVKAHRANLHKQLAETLEAQTQDKQRVQHHILGSHWEEAHNPHRATYWYLRAGETAASNFANQESISHFDSALRCLKKQPHSLNTQQQIATAHSGIAERQIALGQHDDGRASFKSALDVLDSDHPLTSVSILRKLGKSWETHHIHDQALSNYFAAETLLDSQPEHVRNDQWWSEWLEVRSAQLYVHYWQGNTNNMTHLVDQMQSVINNVATPQQQARFLDDRLHLRLREQRFQLDSEGVTIAKEALHCAEQTKELPLICWARFMLGFALYFNQQYHAAIAALLIALDEANSLNDVTSQCRCLTYLTVAHRHLGDLEETQEYAERALNTAKIANMDDYIAAAFANLGWVKWKTHHHDDADTLLRQSRATWDALATTYPYPFQWLGVLPQLALLYQSKTAKDNTDHDKSELSTLNQLLLDTKQQQLPDDIEQPLNAFELQLQRSSAATVTPSAHQYLGDAIEAAKQAGYL